jgi:uncharacterized protein YeaO (DUF488 family)
VTVASDVRLRRVYDEPSASDGVRVLVDLPWPRGLARDAAALDEWLKAIAPSDELRRWYGHMPERFAVFRWRYADELLEPDRAAALAHLRQLAGCGTITLLTATRDIGHSQAAVLAEVLRQGEVTQLAEPKERGGDPACWLPRVCRQCGSMAAADPPTTCPACHAPMPGE